MHVNVLLIYLFPVYALHMYPTKNRTVFLLIGRWKFSSFKINWGRSLGMIRISNDIKHMIQRAIV